MWIAGRLVETGEPARVEIGGGRITRIDSVEHAPDVWIAPGLVDIQVNGFQGHDVNAADVTPETIVDLARVLWTKGITAFCPTVMTHGEERICQSLRAIASARERDPLVARSIPCIHVEGPHISPEDGPRGAHARAFVRPPDLEEYRRWQEAADGAIGIITLAPEYAEAPAYIRAVTSDGVIAAIGHTGANTEQIEAAVHAGARLSTHLGNGAHGVLPRHPNYLWDQLAEDRLWASFIFDGHHLPPAVMTTMLRAKGVARSILVSDAVALAGMPPGVYDWVDGSRVELSPAGRLSLVGAPYLAGSSATLGACIANALRDTGATLAEAVRMASTNPSHLLGLTGPDGRGAVRIGASADLTLLHVDPVTGDVTATGAIVGGEEVYRAEERGAPVKGIPIVE